MKTLLTLLTLISIKAMAADDVPMYPIYGSSTQTDTYQPAQPEAKPYESTAARDWELKSSLESQSVRQMDHEFHYRGN